MKREEAISCIKHELLATVNRKDLTGEAVGEALDMAIKALSAKPTDLISRADAIKAIESRQTEQWIDADIDYNNGLESAVAEIKALPSADRPTEPLEDGTLKVNVKSGAEVNRVLVWGDDGCGGLYYADDRPSGEWKPSYADIPNNCSVCGEDWDKYVYGAEVWYTGELPNYCPNCGAKMGSDAR